LVVRVISIPNDEKNRLEYIFGQQRNEYDVPDSRDAKSESNLEKFVWDLKTVFRRRAIGNGQYPINEIWVKENPWNTLLASRWELQYVTDYNATHEQPVKELEIDSSRQ
jgi:hypothetical protein